jgi:diaminopimelate decarboxylase
VAALIARGAVLAAVRRRPASTERSSAVSASTSAEPSPSLRDLEGVAQRFDTPFYLYDFDVLEARARALRAAIPERFEICYAVKANPSLAVVRGLAASGFGADVASRGELLLALAAGVPAERIVCSGPAKSDRDLSAAVEQRIAGINVEGPQELDRLQAAAERAGVDVPIQLRLAVPWSAGERRRILGGGGAGKFGVDVALAEELLAARGRWPRLRFQGFQVFNASNVRSAAAWVESAARTLDLAVALARRHHLELALVDLGGGLGIPYAAGERPLDLTRLGGGLAAIAGACDGVAELRSTRILVEPGRWLVGPCGLYVARVLEVKPTGGGLVATLDGGIHHFLRPALLGAPHPVHLLAGDGRRLGRNSHVMLAGPLCTSLDTLDPAARIPVPRPGDLVVFRQAGAYGFTESMPLFLSHEWPAELGRARGRQVEALRTPATVDEVRSRQRIPTWLPTSIARSDATARAFAARSRGAAR